MTRGLGMGGTQSYGEPSYWNKRYKDEDSPFDWYQKYPALAPLIHLYLSPDSSKHILIVGCGNSTFSESMAADGFEDIVNIDISNVVIEEMKKKYANHPNLKYITMDVRDMSDLTGSFDAVIDKGTLDSILCGNDSRENATKMLKEVGRALKDKGIYILITYGAPSYRLNLLKSTYNWKIKLHVIEKTLFGTKSEDQQKWELTKPIPLDQVGKSIEDIIGKNLDVHYIYVCTKDVSLEHGEIDASVVA
ncbi:unnamed protein product [Amaranthus hypochondriacus]